LETSFPNVPGNQWLFHRGFKDFKKTVVTGWGFFRGQVGGGGPERVGGRQRPLFGGGGGWGAGPQGGGAGLRTSKVTLEKKKKPGFSPGGPGAHAGKKKKPVLPPAGKCLGGGEKRPTHGAESRKRAGGRRADTKQSEFSFVGPGGPPPFMGGQPEGWGPGGPQGGFPAGGGKSRV